MVYQALDIPLKRFSQVLSRVILTFQGFIKGNFSSSDGTQVEPGAPFKLLQQSKHPSVWSYPSVLYWSSWALPTVPHAMVLGAFVLLNFVHCNPTDFFSYFYGNSPPNTEDGNVGRERSSHIEGIHSLATYQPFDRSSVAPCKLLKQLLYA